jgi:hypothetical protein
MLRKGRTAIGVFFEEASLFRNEPGFVERS